jgi:hypothetical protein
MEAALRPHRGGTVFALGILGILSAFILIPLGIIAWIMGSKDLKAMDGGSVDPSGRSLTQIGRVFGICGSLLWLGTAGCAGLMMCVTVGPMTMYASSSDHPGERTVTKNYAFEGGTGDSSHHEAEWTEVQKPNGQWVKEGHFAHWSRDGKEVEEGSYLDGKRDGPWTFWSEDGAVDKERSGVYQNDVRIGPSPIGDFPGDDVR